ncbi:MAG: ABC transporter ATP-binding protein [Deltaproteobacteria bacterium]|nr:ABC transporter ATP-binding protein [Deltaproteobacteria bacterium]MBW2342939.1 ABC transporter ATP-binding protein [Deltaproteobacteria bacterium]
MSDQKKDPILKINDINLSFGGLHVLKDVSFVAQKGTICALIGPNGSGKTSVLNSINRFYRVDSGEIFFNNKDISKASPQTVAKAGVARTFQNIALFKGMSVLDNIKVGRHFFMKSGVFSGGIYFGKARREEMREREFIEREIIEVLKLESIRDSIVGSLPYGKQKLVEFARALALRPKLLLLDEPSAGMNQEETEDIIRYVLDMKLLWSLSIVLVEHNMDVVIDISDSCCVLNYGRVIAFGSPDDIQNDENVIKAYIGE